MFFDLTFVPIVEAVARPPPDRQALRGADRRAHMPATSSSQSRSPTKTSSPTPTTISQWKEFDENTACGLCYTSGTTGNPKGVLYSHRSNMLHAMMASSARVPGRPATHDAILPVVPMFHANAWALALAGPMLRRQAGDARSRSSTAPPSTSCSTTEKVTMIGGRADRVAGAAQYTAEDRQDALERSSTC